MNFLVSFLISFMAVYILYLILVVLNKKARKKLKTGIEAKFLKKVYKINLSEIDDKKFAYRIAFNNSIIIAFTFCLTDLFFKNTILQILLSFPILILLIIFLYSLTGRSYQHEWFIFIWKRIKSKKYL